MLTEFDLMYMGRSYARLPLYKEALEKWGLIHRNRVLDAGCGYGAWTFTLSKLNNSVIGIERDGNKSNISMQLAEENTQNIDIYTCDIESLPGKAYGLGKFDGILCFHTIYYTHDWKKTLKSLASLMTPNGIMYINIATLDCFIHMISSGDKTTRQMGIDAINDAKRKEKGLEYETMSGLPIEKEEFEEELTKLNLVIDGSGHDIIARHPGVIGYVVKKCVHNDM